MFTSGNGLNEHGQVAGHFFETLWWEGVVWLDGTNYVDLTRFTGWVYTEAIAINDSGLFAGAGAPNPTVMLASRVGIYPPV